MPRSARAAAKAGSGSRSRCRSAPGATVIPPAAKQAWARCPERGGGLLAFVGQDLAVGQAGVVVDGVVQVAVADHRLLAPWVVVAGCCGCRRRGRGRGGRRRRGCWPSFLMSTWTRSPGAGVLVAADRPRPGRRRCQPGQASAAARSGSGPGARSRGACPAGRRSGPAPSRRVTRTLMIRRSTAGRGAARAAVRPAGPVDHPCRAALGGTGRPTARRWSRETWNRSAARRSGQPSSTTQRASRSRPLGVSGALAWDTKTSGLRCGSLDSSTPHSEVFPHVIIDRARHQRLWSVQLVGRTARPSPPRRARSPGRASSGRRACRAARTCPGSRPPSSATRGSTSSGAPAVLRSVIGLPSGGSVSDSSRP